MPELPFRLIFVSVFLCVSVGIVKSHKRKFEVDYKNDVFLKDGEPFHYMSGTLHYFQVPRAYWRDRLRKYRAAGLNAISTYIEWRSNEPLKGKYDFSEDNDFEYFFKLAQEEGLLVILRPGPYIDAERDWGGYPAWLMHENPHMALRSNDSSHTKHVYSWLSELLPRIQPLLYGKGGPVIMVQVENEYGSWCPIDESYKTWLRDVFHRYVGDDAVLFTTDGDDCYYIKNGGIPGVLRTVDGFPRSTSDVNTTTWFENLRKIQPHGPLVNSELYVDWFWQWGKSGTDYHPTIDDIMYTIRQYLLTNTSFNIYFFHGGTNFGFSSGVVNGIGVVPSYVFDAPISEFGNLTEKYFGIKKVISEFVKIDDIKVNISVPAAYGTVKLEPKVSLFESDTGISYGTFSQPKTFESLELYTGFMLYEVASPSAEPQTEYTLEVNGKVHDRTGVYVDKILRGVIEVNDSRPTYSLTLPETGSEISLLVENQGHITYTLDIDLKGILGNVTLNGNILGPWNHTGYPMTNVSAIPTLPSATHVNLPAFYSGSFQLPDPGQPPQDTFVDMTGWGKGILYVNNYNLGRYWPSLGPQMTLYLPAPFLKRNNVFVILELEREHPNRTISLVPQHILHGSVKQVDSVRVTNLAAQPCYTH